jgi:class 3 adenylate cyclase/tetratricopeptide (TPR) repeat protein
MFCPVCGSQAREGARFCAECGAPFVRSCPDCGAPADPNDRFCSSCGVPLQQLQAPPEVGAPEERKTVTCLFADLVGSTAAADRADPEDVRARLAPYYARLRDELESFGGTVEKFIGDAVVAVFGAPVAHEDDAERAAHSGLAIQQAIDDLNEQDRSLDLTVRVGIATGEALVQVQVDARSGEGIVAGDVMNIGARLQAAAPPGGILVDEATHRATRDVIEYRLTEPVQAKGKAEPLRAWEAVGVRRDSAIDRETPLVGRAYELDLLVQALARVRRTRRTQLVTIVGVPGIGKSRLVFELFAAAEANGAKPLRLQGRSVPYGNGVSLNALAEMAKSSSGILETDDAETATTKLQAAVEATVADAADARWVVEHLRPLVGLASGTELDDDRRTEAFAAWRRWIEAFAERSPVALVFEDVHWADDTLLDFIEHLVDWARDVPLFVVATTRPELFERRANWGAAQWNAFSVSLEPLSNEATGELVAALLEQAVLPTVLRARLLERAGGNPLYAGQYVRMLADRALLPHGNGVTDPTQQELPLPETVQGIVAARLDALPPGEKALLHDAAVLGEVFWAGALAEVSSVPPDIVEEQLHALERKEFVRRERRSSVADEDQYTFRHVLMRDVAYSQLARARRAEKHERVADWLQSVSGSRAGDRAELIAHHYLSALELARATRRPTAALEERARLAAVEAGARAATLAAHATAARLLEAALELTPKDHPSRATLLLQLGQARLRAQQTGAEELEEAREAFLAAGDANNAAVANVLLSILRTDQGRRTEALENIRRAAELVANSEPSPVKAFVLSHTSRALMRVGEADESMRVAREVLTLAEQFDLGELRAHALNNIGGARLVKGDHLGLEEFERSLAISRPLNSPEVARGCRLLGGALTVEGDLERASELFAEGRRMVERLGDAFHRRWLDVALVLEEYWRGNWDAALEGADEFIAELERGSPHYMETACRRVRSLIRIARGDELGAGDDSERALAVARVSHDPWFLNQAIALRARVLAKLGELGQADTLVDELLEIWSRAEGATAPGFDSVDLALAVRALGRADDLADVAGSRHRTRWFTAALALAAGDFRGAADRFRAIGSVPDEAYARLLAARESGDEQELHRAMEFFRRVGANGLIRQADQPVGDGGL